MVFSFVIFHLLFLVVFLVVVGFMSFGLLFLFGRHTSVLD